MDLSGVTVDLSGATATTDLADIINHLKYLFGLGLTADSGNETLNTQLEKYKELTNTDYVPEIQPSDSDLDTIIGDIKYLYDLGLRPESNNDTLNNRLLKYKNITGSDYSSSPSSSS